MREHLFGVRAQHITREQRKANQIGQSEIVDVRQPQRECIAIESGIRQRYPTHTAEPRNLCVLDSSAVMDDTTKALRPFMAIADPELHEITGGLAGRTAALPPSRHDQFRRTSVRFDGQRCEPERKSTKDAAYRQRQTSLVVTTRQECAMTIDDDERTGQPAPQDGYCCRQHGRVLDEYLLGAMPGQQGQSRRD